MATLAEQLVNVQAAIEAAESAQSVSGGGRSRQMADLDTLYGRERDLLNRISLTTRPTTATWGTQAGSLSFMGKAVTNSGGFMQRSISYKESETSIRLTFILKGYVRLQFQAPQESHGGRHPSSAAGSVIKFAPWGSSLPRASST